jgi:hypothetical protein
MSNNEEGYTEYLTNSGEVFKFDTSKTVFETYGFYPGARVNTPKGTATVIGIYDNFLWFHVDGDQGASYWHTAKSYEDLLEQGFTQINDLPEAVVETPSSIMGFYLIKRVDYKQKTVNILLQNENGPCPLIAIANTLALRNLITIDEGKNHRIHVDDVISKISNYLRKEYANEPGAQEGLSKAIKELPKLERGLQVNFGFKSCESFELDAKAEVFEFLKIRMLHGWLIDPNHPVAHIIEKHYYDDLLYALVQDQSDPLTNSTPQEARITPDQAVLIQEFLNTAQLTEFGLQKLHQSIDENELVVFFRNNHFLTITKHNGKLYSLITDIGYEKERLVVWDQLSSVDGNSCFFTSDFLSTQEAKIDEIRNTALCFGFNDNQVDAAICAVIKPNEELKVDEVLTYLNSNFSIA